MLPTPSAVLIQIGVEPDDDAEAVERTTLYLRQHLLALDVDDVQLVHADDLPAGAKVGDIAIIGSLLATFVATMPRLRAMVDALRSGLGEGRSVTLEMDGDSLTMTGVSTADQHRLVEAWIERHTLK